MFVLEPTFVSTGSLFGMDFSHELELLFRKIGEMAHEYDELPDLVIRVLAFPSRHARETNAISDDREQLAVREFLGTRVAQIRRGRVEPFAISVFPLPSTAWQSAQWSAK